MAQDINVSELFRAILDKTDRKSKNPSGHPSFPTTAYQELPISITIDILDILSSPIWAKLEVNNPKIEDFTNTGNSDVDLNTLTGWTAQGGTINVSTGDWAYHSSGTAIYTVSRSEADHRVSCALTLSHDLGLVWRLQDSSNYWALLPLLGGTYQVYLDGSPVQDTGISPSDGDVLEVDCIGNLHFIKINHQLVHIEEDSTHNTETDAGIIALSTSTGRMDFFRAWDIAGTVLNYDADPGHTFWDAPETWI